jgi:hypothetical protein
VKAWRARRSLPVAIVALGVIGAATGALWRTATRPSIPQVVMRGRGTLGLIAAWQDDGTLRVSWGRTPKTVLYHVRVSGSTGVELVKTATLPQLSLSDSEVASLGEVTVTVEEEATSGERTSKSSTLRPVTRAAAR